MRIPNIESAKFVRASWNAVPRKRSEESAIWIGIAAAVAYNPLLLMHFLWTLLIGFVIGLVAKMLTPGRDPKGCLITAGIGIAGSFIAKFLGEALNIYSPGQIPGFIGSVIGAIVLLVGYRLVRDKSQ